MLSLINKIYYYFLKVKKQRYINKLKDKGLVVGKKVWFVDTFFLDPSHCYLISIGDNCTICPNVRFIAHDASIKKILGFTKFGKISIEENCFIGDSTIILPGVTIGANSIIGSGSVVTKNIPANIVAAGNPARPICSINDYVTKIKSKVTGETKIFGKEYDIEKLDSKKRSELLSAVQNSIGFIL